MRGLTWDHPRGINPLRQSAERWGSSVIWESQPLEGFESAPLDELFEVFDVIVIDHPHLGDAIATKCIQPVSEWANLAQDQYAPTNYVGPSLASYTVDGELWALPLDAAAQVAASEPSMVNVIPTTWDAVLSSLEEYRVGLCLAGPHAFLSFLSIYTAYCGRNILDDFDCSAAKTAYSIMTAIAARMDPTWWELNPIGLLDSMAKGNGPNYCPLVFGYVNYSQSPKPGARRLFFHDAPTGETGNIGSVIGGTGLAVSAQASLAPDEVAYLLSLIKPDVQQGSWVNDDGQPARIEAWTNPEIDATAYGFYSQTLSTLEQSFVRPRYPGFTRTQDDASTMLRKSLAEKTPENIFIEKISKLFNKRI